MGPVLLIDYDCLRFLAERVHLAIYARFELQPPVQKRYKALPTKLPSASVKYPRQAKAFSVNRRLKIQIITSICNRDFP